MDNSDIILGKNIAEFRNKLELTQENLADYLGISRVEMNYYENGKRPMPTTLISKAAKLFAIDEYDLFELNSATKQTALACAFRATDMSNDDLNEIASFKTIALNYLKMKKALSTHVK